MMWRYLVILAKEIKALSWRPFYK